MLGALRRENGRRDLAGASLLFFGALVVASFSGGTVHGFFPDPESTPHRLLWRATLLSIGLVSLASWGIGSALVLTGRARRVVLVLAGGFLAAYALYVLLVDQRFVVAIIGYLPATIFLLVAFAVARRRGRSGAGWGVTGVLVTFAASFVQQAGIGLHPRYFDHNALYHSIQAVALWLFFVALRRLLREPPREPAS